MRYAAPLVVRQGRACCAPHCAPSSSSPRHPQPCPAQHAHPTTCATLSHVLLSLGTPNHTPLYPTATSCVSLAASPCARVGGTSHHVCNMHIPPRVCATCTTATCATCTTMAPHVTTCATCTTMAPHVTSAPCPMGPVLLHRTCPLELYHVRCLRGISMLL